MKTLLEATSAGEIYDIIKILPEDFRQLKYFRARKSALFKRYDRFRRPPLERTPDLIAHYNPQK